MLAMADPSRFAAIAPVCGSGIYWNTGCLVNLPVYIYHGDLDDIVPLCEGTNMLTSLHKKGGNAKIKILYGVKHNAWDLAYQDEELLEWMLAQKRGAVTENASGDCGK